MYIHICKYMYISLFLYKSKAKFIQTGDYFRYKSEFSTDQAREQAKVEASGAYTAGTQEASPFLYICIDILAVGGAYFLLFV